MRTAYFDCFSGISGDMTLGALLHAGAPEERFRELLASLQVPGYDLDVRPVVKEGIAALQADVRLHEKDLGHGRHLADVREIVEGSPLADGVKARTMGAFTRLAEAEARIHATTPDQIHFHEVGAIDAIVDITGACILLDLLDIERVYASPMPFARGWVECAHGTMPTPAPATMELLAGFTLRPDERQVELVTPTGAALLAEFAERTPEGAIAPAPPMMVSAMGYGAGARDTEIPNLLRVILGDVPEAA